MKRQPNLLMIITDQQRAPMYDSAEPGWIESVTPADAELRRTGISFTNACTATSMCSPSRASFLTGAYPSRHGVTLTLSEGDLFPQPENFPATIKTALKLAATGEAPAGTVAKMLTRTALKMGPIGGHEPELPAGFATIGSRLRDAGYTVVLKGKWHLTKPYGGYGNWSKADAERVERDYGFSGWEPPDAGGNVDPDAFGGGNAGALGEGFDEDYTRQALKFLGAEDLPEPFCLIVSLINPHDVLGFPTTYAEGGYSRDEFSDIEVTLPETLNEDLRTKPTAHSVMKLGQMSYIGPLGTDQKKLDYLRFYAHLQRQVDQKIGRLLDAMGDANDPASLRARTVVTRFSDHGEMGLAHGGLRQKMFNTYEETIRVPLVVSNPLLFPAAEESPAAVSLVDVVPTLLGLAGVEATGTIDGKNLCGVLASKATPDANAIQASETDFAGVTEAPKETTVRDRSFFTYDDHQAATANQNTVPNPNRIRSIRGERWKYAVYIDPTGKKTPEYELYDLEADPIEEVNMVDKSTGRGINSAARAVLPEQHEALAHVCEETEMNQLAQLPTFAG